jgi:hypothetical protein
MGRWGSALLAVFCLGCGADAPESEAVNHAPLVDEAQITPAAPTAADGVSLVLKVHDPDRDAVKVSIQWYRNGRPLPAGTGATLPPQQFRRGDQIHAVVHATDGLLAVEAASDTIEIINAAPRVTGLTVEPVAPGTADALTATAQGSDTDGDALEYRYRWYRNGDLLPEQSATLPAGSAQRGDEVSASAAAHDGQVLGDWVSSGTLQLRNAAPVISTQPEYLLGEGGMYVYDVGATDPDGDTPLRYELIEGPPGMSVDGSTGQVSWQLPSDASGVYPIELTVTDTHGGRTVQRYTLELAPPEPPANQR